MLFNFTPQVIALLKNFYRYFVFFMGIGYGFAILGVILRNFLINKKVDFPLIKYSVKNVYLALSIFVLAALFAALQIHQFRFFVFFVLTGFVGMCAEAFYSYVWKLFFAKPNWKYTELPLFRGFTSWYNFIPWSVGFVVFLGILLKLESYFDVSELSYIWNSFLAIMIVGTFIELLLGLILKNTTKNFLVKFSLLNFLLFSMPVFLGIVFVGISFGWIYIVFSLLMGAVAFVTEYLYGKLMHIFFGRQLWYYNYLPLDGNHTSITNFFGAIGGGYIFIGFFVILANLF
jgi:hypothetical protein